MIQTNKNMSQEYKSALEIKDGKYIFKEIVEEEVTKIQSVSIDAFNEINEDKREDLGGQDIIDYLEELKKKEKSADGAEKKAEKVRNVVESLRGKKESTSEEEDNTDDEVHEKSLEELKTKRSRALMFKEGIYKESFSKSNSSPFVVNDEIARSWLSLTHRKDFTPEEFSQFKLLNEIEDMERYLKNKADILNEKAVFISHKKVNSTYEKPEEWPVADHNTFLEYFCLFNKKFHIIAELMNKSTKEIILHYYLTKKKERYNKKKNGRLSDSNLKIIIDLEWTEGEKSKFQRLYDFYGKNWRAYEESFTGKSVGDFKNYFRYLSKSKEEEREAKDKETRDQETKDKESKDQEIKEEEEKTKEKSMEEEVPANNKEHSKKNSEEQETSVTKKEQKSVKSKSRKKGRRKAPATKKKTEPAKVKKVRLDKENNTNTKENILEEWTIDERQLFAIFYPYIGKNWIDISQYITTKKPGDCRTYFKFYFKNLSLSEQKLEAAMRNIERNTFSVPNSPRRLNDDGIIDDVGIIFKR